MSCSLPRARGFYEDACSRIMVRGGSLTNIIPTRRNMDVSKGGRAGRNEAVRRCVPNFVMLKYLLDTNDPFYFQLFTFGW